MKAKMTKGTGRAYRISGSKVLESRETPDGTMIRRRRETKDGVRFTTYERIERAPLMVLKRSGSKENFDREKLHGAVYRSVGKFLNSEQEINTVVERVVNEIYDLGAEEVTSRQIGNAVLDVLADVNEVAYVRFASVFQEFKTLDEFEQIIRQRRGRRKK